MVIKIRAKSHNFHSPISIVCLIEGGFIHSVDNGLRTKIHVKHFHRECKQVVVVTAKDFIVYACAYVRVQGVQDRCVYTGVTTIVWLPL